MHLFDLFSHVVKRLEEQNIPFALAGGFAAALYRAEPRVTMDVDLCIAVDQDAERLGREILEESGLTVGVVREADLAGGPLFAIQKKNTAPAMLVGRSPGESTGGIDLLLPSIPWIRQAVERAQDHRADFGFGEIPVLRIEDMLLSKLYALHRKVRPKDLDDLQSILAAEEELDISYLRQNIKHLGLKLPTTGRELVPELLRQLFR